jgi:hypothetical protein
MHWRIVPNAVAVVVHADQDPADDDWDAYLADLAKNVTQINGVLVYSDKVGPSAPQRARSNAAFAKGGRELETVIMTSSRVVRGIITALNWAVEGKVKAFSTHEFDAAIAVFKLEADSVLKVKVTLKQLARSANVTIDAFADESGQFRQKFK